MISPWSKIGCSPYLRGKDRPVTATPQPRTSSVALTPDAIQPGHYRHYKGNEYEVIGIATHSETFEPMVIYRPLYGEAGLWVRPAAMFGENVTLNGKILPRFVRL